MHRTLAHGALRALSFSAPPFSAARRSPCPKRHLIAPEDRKYSHYRASCREISALAGPPALLKRWEELGLFADVNGHQQHLEIKSEVLPIAPGGGDFTVVYPADVDACIDMYIGQGREDRDPVRVQRARASLLATSPSKPGSRLLQYWARPWPSAVALADQILRRPDLVRGLKVADLGCGLGLAGIAAGMAGAREVVLLDRCACAACTPTLARPL